MVSLSARQMRSRMDRALPAPALVGNGRLILLLVAQGG
jgi:hypothetical protein